jgi:anti-anti-sigma factor
MEIKLDTAADPVRLTLAGEMTIYAASELHGRLIGALDACGALAIDLSAIDEIDSAGLQLLLLARQHATVAGKPFALAAISRPVGELLALYELAALFGDPPLGAPTADHRAAGEPA